MEENLTFLDLDLVIAITLTKQSTEILQTVARAVKSMAVIKPITNGRTLGAFEALDFE
jgi:hypothetical protein